MFREDTNQGWRTKAGNNNELRLGVAAPDRFEHQKNVNIIN
jgi:hypothetical protein